MEHREFKRIMLLVVGIALLILLLGVSCSTEETSHPTAGNAGRIDSVSVEKVAERQTVTYEEQESEVFKKGKRQLEVQGYKDIKEEGGSYWCCDENDSIWRSTGFTAKTPDGEIVEGCFCVKKSWFNGSVTIRFK